MTLRINSGWCRGMTLKSPPGLHTRPTASRVREAVWNSLQTYTPGADILDIFSGSGAFGIEGMSRGAHSAIFIDSDRQAQAAIRVNIKGVQERASRQGRQVQLQLMGLDAKDAICSLQSRPRFDIVWLDPPYALVNDFVAENFSGIRVLLKDAGILGLESDCSSQEFIVSTARQHKLGISKQKTYGSTLITFLFKE